jgi:hypothetical protein
MVTFRITRFVHRRDFWINKICKVSLAFSKGPNRVGVSIPSSEDGNWSSFRNVVFSSYLEFRTMDNVHKPSHSKCIVRFNKTGFYNLSEVSSIELIFSHPMNYWYLFLHNYFWDAGSSKVFKKKVTTGNWVLLENLIVWPSRQEMSTNLWRPLYTKVNHWLLFWVTWIEPQSPNLLLLSYLWIISHLYLGLPSGFCSSGFCTKSFYNFSFFSFMLHAPGNMLFLLLIILIRFSY